MNDRAFSEIALSTIESDSAKASDLRASLLLVARHGERIRYVREAGRFLVYDERRWVADFGDLVLRMAQSIPRELYAIASTVDDSAGRRRLTQLAGHCESRRALEAMLKLAPAHPEIIANASDFDRDPLLLNVAHGTLDLRTGELRAHAAEDMLTKLTPVPYEPDAPCERWLRFLAEVFEGDVDLVNFIQRAVGYSLTGLTREQCLFVLYGSGANGKSSFLEALRLTLGDYASTAAAETFMQRDRKATNDIARLAGARFVSAVEVERGQRLAESFVKSATGGDPVVARFMFREFFEFVPAFKLWLACNYKPTISGSDEGIWRRIRLVPFNARFDGGDRDQNLGQTLAAEAAGILAWAVRGALDWQRGGLGLPQIVEAATRAYRADSDVLGQFIDEVCVLAPNALATARELRDAYRRWATENGERAISSKALAERLKERGLASEHGRTGGRWRGIGLRCEDGRDGCDGSESISVNLPPRARISEEYKNAVDPSHPSRPCGESGARSPSVAGKFSKTGARVAEATL